MLTEGKLNIGPLSGKIDGYMYNLTFKKVIIYQYLYNYVTQETINKTRYKSVPHHVEAIFIVSEEMRMGQS